MNPIIHLNPTEVSRPTRFKEQTWQSTRSHGSWIRVRQLSMMFKETYISMTSFVLFVRRKQPSVRCFHKCKQIGSSLLGTKWKRITNYTRLDVRCTQKTVPLKFAPGKLHVIWSWEGVGCSPMNQNVIEDNIVKPIISAKVHEWNILFCDNLHSESDKLSSSGTATKKEARSFLWLYWPTLGCLSLCMNKEPKKCPT